jgi:hypothetical protein
LQGVIRIIFTIFDSLVEKHHSIISNVEAKTKPGAFNCNVAIASDIYMWRELIT